MPSAFSQVQEAMIIVSTLLYWYIYRSVSCDLLTRGTAAAGAGLARNGLVLGDSTLTGALAGGTRAY